MAGNPYRNRVDEYRTEGMFVKICGITNEDDALLAVAMDADAVGFIFAPSPRQVPAQQVYDITRRLPPEIITVGVFRDEHPRRTIEIARKAGVKAVQLHGNESPDTIAEVSKAIPMVIKAFPAGSPRVVTADELEAHAILLDSPSPGSGKMFDWSLAGEVPSDVRLILAGGLTPDNVAAAVTAVEPWGVDVASGVERTDGNGRSGKKDPLKVKRFVERARAAAPQPYVAANDLPYDWSIDE